MAPPRKQSPKWYRRSVLGLAAGSLAGCIDPGPSGPTSPTSTPNPATDVLDPGKEIFVAMHGDDSNDGSESSPLATLQAARDMVRSMDSLPDGGVAITIKEGTYRRDSALELTEADSGTEDNPIVYRAPPRRGRYHHRWGLLWLSPKRRSYSRKLTMRWNLRTPQTTRA